MPSPRAVGVRLPGRPPPPDRLRERVRRRALAVGAFPGLRHWLLVRGSVLLVAFAVLYVANGLTIGWETTYDVTIGITSPGDTKMPPVAWVISLAGWLAAPAVCGAVAGVVIVAAVDRRRRRPIAEVLAKR